MLHHLSASSSTYITRTSHVPLPRSPSTSSSTILTGMSPSLERPYTALPLSSWTPRYHRPPVGVSYRHPSSDLFRKTSTPARFSRTPALSRSTFYPARSHRHGPQTTGLRACSVARRSPACGILIASMRLVTAVLVGFCVFQGAAIICCAPSGLSLFCSARLQASCIELVVYPNQTTTGFACLLYFI